MGRAAAPRGRPAVPERRPRAGPWPWCRGCALVLAGAARAAAAPGAEQQAHEVLESMVRPGADTVDTRLDALRYSLEAEGGHGSLALLYLLGVPDGRGRLEFPHGFPRNLTRALEHLSLGLEAPRERADGWSYTVLGLLLSLGVEPAGKVPLELGSGPTVRAGGAAGDVWQAPLDAAGAAYWEAAERQEPLGGIAFASLVRRGLTEVPLDWDSHRRPVLTRVPELLLPDLPAGQLAPDRACRALGTLVNPASRASHNEQPLLDRAALTWKAWRHRQRKPPEDEEWTQTKEYVDAIRHAADVVQEPRSMREMGAVHFTGHTEAKVSQSTESAEKYWHQAAKEGDFWSAWYAALSHVNERRFEEAAPYLDIVGNASAGAFTYMAIHFKHRLGIGVEPNPQHAGLFLRAAADLGNSNAQLILAHSYMGYSHGNMEGVEPPGGPDKRLALAYYKAAAANGRLVPKLNAALLTAQGADPEVTSKDEQCVAAYRGLSEVVHAAHPAAHLLFAHARRAYDLGDAAGARLRFSLLSDAGFLHAHLNAAWLWDQAAGEAAPGASGSAEPPADEQAGAAAAHARAYYYHRRAASLGHAPSMNELSARLLGHPMRVPREVLRLVQRPTIHLRF